jgi:mRNA interferase MazF
MLTLPLQDYRFGDVVLVSFPFTNLTQAKRRPALVLLDMGDPDVVVARITSKLHETQFDALLQDWQQAGLMLPSVVRIHKIVTLDKQLVERKLGVLTPGDVDRVHERIQLFYAAQVES